jgi:hypothetical protein
MTEDIERHHLKDGRTDETSAAAAVVVVVVFAVSPLLCACSSFASCVCDSSNFLVLDCGDFYRRNSLYRWPTSPPE